MTTNIERAAEILEEWTDRSWGLAEDNADAAAQTLADAGLLMPDLPEPNEKGFWIPFEENQDEYFEMWVSIPGSLKVDGSRRWRKRLTPENARSIAFALLAAADHAEQEQGNG